MKFKQTLFFVITILHHANFLLLFNYDMFAIDQPTYKNFIFKIFSCKLNGLKSYNMFIKFYSKMNILKCFGSCFLILLMLSCNKKADIKKAEVLPSPKTKVADTLKFNMENFPVYSIQFMAQNDSLARQFISLSNRYFEKDIMPAYLINNQKKVPFEKLKRINLPSSYRQKMLAGTGVKENDFLFLFNYKSGKLEKIAVNKLNAVACLNYYASEGDDVSEDSYMLGLEINEDFPIGDLSDRTYTSLAYFGAENPFADQPLTAINWTKISTSGLPGNKTKNDTLRLKEAFRFETQDMVYYAEDFTHKDVVAERQLTVKNKSGKLIYDRSYNLNFEGTYFETLDGGEESVKETYQWTGILFKNQAPVIFDMVDYSFGCPEITFLDPSYESFFIYCDNRH